jgi:MYXO-CTERM domain-containing protein
MKALLRGSLATLVGSVALFVASTALADGEACYNDIDCPGTACGDAVCNWTKTAKMPVGEKVFGCNPAGSQTPVGRDGWCTTDADCKCKAEGATCQLDTPAKQPYCTFTKPPGAGTGGTGAGGTGTAGTATTAGTTSAAGTASGGSAPTTPAPAADSGGCSLSVPGGSNTALALGVGLLGLGVAFARRRR